MVSFLEQLTRELVDKHSDLGRLVIITPGKRAGMMLKQELKRQCQETVFAPCFYSIQEFVSVLSDLKIIRDLPLLFEFYDIYLQTQPKVPQSLLEFMSWGQTLLLDFSEIDRFVVPPKEIFAYLKAFKEMSQWSLEQTSVKDDSKIYFWEEIETYYELLQQRLLNQSIAYEGLLYRKAVEKIDDYLGINDDKYFVFVGFNALSKSEELIFQGFLENGSTDIYWDIDKQFIEDKDHEAGLFIRKYKSQWQYYQNHPMQWISDVYSSDKTISLTAVSGYTGQAYHAAKLVEQQKGKTVIITGDEHLSLPLLGATKQFANLTMGYPISQSQWVSFFRAYLQIYLAERTTWYYKDIIRLLSHPVFRSLYPLSENMVSAIYQDQKMRVDWYYFSKKWSEIYPNKTCPLICPEKIVVSDCLFACLDILLIYQRTDEPSSAIHEHVARYLIELFTELQTMVSDSMYIEDIRTLYHVFGMIVSSAIVPLEGSLEGDIQVMGMLESRGLDFDNVIITSVNEGILPSTNHQQSFLTYELRNAMSMPTNIERDAIYAYHFYRLLQRAKNVHLIYNADVSEGGDKSRYLLQLEIEHLPQHQLIYNSALSRPSISKPYSPKLIQKDDAYLRQIVSISKKGFSPSALTSYIRNPLDFYTHYVLGIRDEYEIEESLAANTFGTIAHNTLEILYKPHIGRSLDTKDLQKMLGFLPNVVQQQFTSFAVMTVDGRPSYSQGKNYIIYHVIIEYLQRFLQGELTLLKEGHELKILAVEIEMKDIPLIDDRLDFEVYMRGKIDRIDELDGQPRIIDYKSGKVIPSDLKLLDMSLIHTDEKYTKAFQLLMYGLMLSQSGIYNIIGAQAGIISFKNNREGFMPFDYDGQQLLTEDILSTFQDQMIDLIKSIIDFENPIEEKEPANSFKKDSLF